jgi:hypothetical protein
MAHALADRPAFRPPDRPAPPSLRRPLPLMLTLALVAGAAVGAAFAIRPLLGVAVLILVATALALAQRPQLSVYLMVTIAPACAGLHRGLLVPGLRISEAAIAGLGALVLLFAPRLRRPSWSGVEMLLLAYAVFTVALGGYDLLVREAPLTMTDLGTLLGPLQFVLLVRAVVVAMSEERYRVRAAQLLIAAAVLVALVALAQFGNVGPTRSVLTTLTGSSLYSSSLGEGIGRVTGPFNIWHELAGVLMPSALLALALLLDTRSPLRRACYGLALLLIVMALLSSAAVGVTIATVIGALYICWRRRVLHVALAFAVPLAVIAALFFAGPLSGRAEQQYAPSAASYRSPLVPQSLSYRYALFQEQNAPALAGKWGTGYGPDLPPRLALGDFPFTQTTYVSLLMRGGVPLLVVFLVLILAVVRSARRSQRQARTDFEWSLATVVLVMSVSYLFLQLIESYLLDSGPPHAYWAFVGLMLAASGRSRYGRE